jgi:SAM-dependent methyltransferase
MLKYFYTPVKVVGELLKGKSLGRTLLNLSLEAHCLSGTVLDLGSKSGSSSYYRYFKKESNTRLEFTDLQKSAAQVQVVDVEKVLPYPSESFNCVLALNLFEHVFNFSLAPSEIYRILKPGGRFFISVPFLCEFHADPEDFYRFTDSAMLKIWSTSGFRCIHRQAIGEGLLTWSATKFVDLIFPRFLRPLFSAIAYLTLLPFDRLIAHRPEVHGKRVPERFALHHLMVFQK